MGKAYHAKAIHVVFGAKERKGIDSGGRHFAFVRAFGVGPFGVPTLGIEKKRHFAQENSPSPFPLGT